MTRSYEELGQLGDLYLEDSYLLRVDETTEHVTFVVEAVIVEGSEWWTPKKPDEQYSYRRVRIDFPNVKETKWRRRDFQQIPPAPGDEPDFGSIDYFAEVAAGKFRLVGEWGDVEIESGPPEVRLDDALQRRSGRAAAPVRRGVPNASGGIRSHHRRWSRDVRPVRARRSTRCT